MTGLEGRFLLKKLSSASLCSLILRLSSQAHEKRALPNLTTNQMAQLCVEGKEIDEPENDPAWGRCPLLDNGVCIAYEGRPMMCRSMISKTVCSEKGYAEIDPFAITVSTVCLQLIEHIDTSGYFGNLIDVLLHLSGENRFPNNLISNHPISILMVPPEHQEKLHRDIETLQREILS